MSDNGSGDDGSQDGAPDDKGAPPSKPDSNRPLVIATLVSIALLFVGLAAYLYLARDIRADVWQEATVPYDETSCAEAGACEVYAVTAGGHGGHGPEAAIDFLYNPAIDDEIAQWGDCLGSVFTCIETGMLEAEESGAGSNRGAVISSCVAEAECPGECKDRFADRARGRDFDRLEALFFDMFVEERGYCVPREADQ